MCQRTVRQAVMQGHCSLDVDEGAVAGVGVAVAPVDACRGGLDEFPEILKNRWKKSGIFRVIDAHTARKQDIVCLWRSTNVKNGWHY